MLGSLVSERSLGVPAHYTFRSCIHRQWFRIPAPSFACLSGVVPGVAQSGPFGRLWSPTPLALCFPTSLSHCDGKGRLVGSPIPHPSPSLAYSLQEWVSSSNLIVAARTSQRWQSFLLE